MRSGKTLMQAGANGLGVILKMLIVLGVAAAVIYGGMFALSTFVEPEERDITVSVQPGKFNR
jgi:hypothetical protein